MPRQKKMICHDCGTIFNRKPQNGDKQICWNCKSLRVTLVTDGAPPTPPTPTTPTIPLAPDSSGLKMPAFKPNVGGGGITPEMLLKQRGQLKKVVRPPVVLPGPVNSPIPKGVRVLAYEVKNPVIRANGIELELIWRPRGVNSDWYAYLVLPSVDLSPQLRAIASGATNPEHSNFNSRYNNLSYDLPTRKGPRAPAIFQGIRYFEYGWKRLVAPNAQWYAYRNGVRSPYSKRDNQDANAFLRNLRQSKLFTERLVIAETGEIFYTPDHYGSFYRYHPGTMDWYKYRSAGGATGPTWDESFYEEPTGA
ncbi:MAG TPA: hypothetical protein VGN16_20170 [Acidobacteriaceae bacterium]|jgi:hypothetical protein